MRTILQLVKKITSFFISRNLPAAFSRQQNFKNVFQFLFRDSFKVFSSFFFWFNKLMSFCTSLNSGTST